MHGETDDHSAQVEFLVKFQWMSRFLMTSHHKHVSWYKGRGLSGIRRDSERSAKGTKQLAEHNLNKNGGTNGERKYSMEKQSVSDGQNCHALRRHTHERGCLCSDVVCVSVWVQRAAL